MVIKIRVWLLLFVLCIAIQTRSHAQYFSKVYDIDSSADWGYDIFRKADSSYIILGGGLKNNWGVLGISVSKDGSQVISKNRVLLNGGSYYEGNSGRAKRLTDSTYIMPLIAVWPKLPNDYRSGGMVLLDKNGDTIFTRLYTDTAHYEELIKDCAVIHKGYVLGGIKLTAGLSITSGSGLIHRTDTLGNIIWSKFYSNNIREINSIEVLDNGNILAGGDDIQLVWVGQYFYYRHRPHFMLIDSANGNILTDTLYSKGFAGQSSQGGGNIFKDKNGGYFHWGSLDTLYVGEPVDSYTNFWDYLMHLDENFRQDWITIYPFTLQTGHKYIWLTRQTVDSGYLHIGSNLRFDSSRNKLVMYGWAAKLDKHGNTVWDNTYAVDSDEQNYLTDGVEMPDGGFAFTGSTKDGSLPSWHRQDVWLLRVDANGCEVPGCTPTRVAKNVFKVRSDFTIYPNPAITAFTAETTEAGVMNIYNLQGQQIMSRQVAQGKTYITLPYAAAGVYMVRYTSGSKTEVTRLVYEP